MINEFNSEQQFILDAMVEGILGIDAEGTITFCNEALSRMTGYSKEEIVGENAHDLLHHSWVDGSRYPREECDLTKVILLGKPRQMVGGPLWKKDGTYIPVEYCGRPLQRSGSRTCYVGTIRDLSEIEMAREALRRSDEKAEGGEMRTGAEILRLILEYEQLIHGGTSRTESAHQLSMRNRNFSPKFFEALVTLDPNAEESEIQKCRIEDLTPGMILQEEVRSTTGGLTGVARAGDHSNGHFQTQELPQQAHYCGRGHGSDAEDDAFFREGRLSGETLSCNGDAFPHKELHPACSANTPDLIREGVSRFTPKAIT